jgi:Icc-related predicted phosphoesterase
MKIVTISDTHGKHWQLTNKGKIPEGDIIIHAGDATPRGRYEDVEEFFRWFGDLDFDRKIMIAGNHDWEFEKNPKDCEEMATNYGIDYLNDSGIVHNGIKIWGSPVQPEFLSWAFNRARTLAEAQHKQIKEIKPHWDMIPKDTDILITHGPAYDRLDKVMSFHPSNPGVYVGCEELEKAIQRIRPVLHVCGHIHEARGYLTDRPRGKSPITYVNAASLDECYQLYGEDAFVFEWNKLLNGQYKNYSALNY